MAGAMLSQGQGHDKTGTNGGTTLGEGAGAGSCYMCNMHLTGMQCGVCPEGCLAWDSQTQNLPWWGHWGDTTGGWRSLLMDNAFWREVCQAVESIKLVVNPCPAAPTHTGCCGYEVRTGLARTTYDSIWDACYEHMINMAYDGEVATA